MTCRQEILEAASEVMRNSGKDYFTVSDVIYHMNKKGTTYKKSTIRTHIVSSMCRNAPANHMTRYDDLYRIGPGTYRLLHGTDLDKSKTPPISFKREIAIDEPPFRKRIDINKQDIKQINGKEFINKFGFRNAGYWELVNGSLTLALNNYKNVGPALYAFVSGNEVLYIGYTKLTVNTRLSQYQSPGPSQRTNIRNKSHLVDLIKQTGSIEIMVWFDDSVRNDDEVFFDKAAGYESSLIEILSPKWNRRR